MPRLKAVKYTNPEELVARQRKVAIRHLPALRKKYHNRCANCGTMANLTVDHILPLSKGGRTNFENLQLLCFGCNTRKADNLVEKNPGEARKARFVRFLRVEMGCSWRKVAEVYAEMFEDQETSQHRGMELCTMAAKHFGEDPSAEPWN